MTVACLEQEIQSPEGLLQYQKAPLGGAKSQIKWPAYFFKRVKSNEYLYQVWCLYHNLKDYFSYLPHQKGVVYSLQKLRTSIGATILSSAQLLIMICITIY